MEISLARTLGALKTFPIQKFKRQHGFDIRDFAERHTGKKTACDVAITRNLWPKLSQVANTTGGGGTAPLNRRSDTGAIP